MCKSRNIHTYIHPYPTDDHWEFQGGGGYQSLKYLMQCMKLKWKFQGGGRVQTKKQSCGGGG